MKKLQKAISQFRNSFAEERGIVAAIYPLVIGAILLYAFVTYKYMINTRQRATLNSIVVSTLNAAINASPGDIVPQVPPSPGKDIFTAACSMLRGIMFGGEARISCKSTDLVLQSPQVQNRWQANYVATPASGGLFLSDDRAFSCDTVQFDYQGILPGQPGEGPLPQRLCVKLSCKGYQLIPISTIDAVAAEGCIEGDRPIAYVGYDTSDDSAKTFIDCPGGNLASCKKTYPPSSVVMGNDQYLNQQTAAQHPSFSYYTTPQAAGGAGWSLAGLWSAMLDAQPTGIGPQLDQNTGLPPPAPNQSTHSLMIPFRENEFDQVENQNLPDWYQYTNLGTNQCKYLNPDIVDQSVVEWLPLGHTAKNGEIQWSGYAKPDPLPYIYGVPRIGLDSSSIMDEWFEAESPNQAAVTDNTYRLQSRGGEMTANVMRNACYGPLVSTSKHAVQQTLYSLAANNIQGAMLSFSNFVIPKMPVLPLSLYSQLNYQIDTAPLLGPPPANVPGGIDYIEQQFSDLSADPGNRISWNRALILNHAMAACARDASLSDSNSSHPWAAFPDFNNPTAARSYWSVPHPPYAPYSPGVSAGSCNGGMLPTGIALPYYDTGYHMLLDKEQCCRSAHFAAGNLCQSCNWALAGAGEHVCKFTNNTACNNGPGNAYGEMKNLEANDLVSSWRWCPNFAADPAPTLPVVVQSQMTGNFSWYGLPENKGGSNPSSDIFSARTFPTNSFGAERAAPAALLSMLRALKDPNLVASWRLKAVILFINGAPDLSIWDTIDNPGTTQAYFSGPDPVGELPRFVSGNVTCPAATSATQVSSAVQEFVTLAHQVVSNGIKLFIIYLPPPHDLPGAVDRLSVVKAGLSGPNKGSRYAPGQVVTQPLNASEWCNPNAPALNGVNYLEYKKQDNETYAQYEQRVLQQISTTLLYDLLKFRLTK